VVIGVKDDFTGFFLDGAQFIPAVFIDIFPDERR
jgi:hypothetical protein